MTTRLFGIRNVKVRATGGFQHMDRRRNRAIRGGAPGRLPRPARVWAIALYRTKAGRSVSNNPPKSKTGFIRVRQQKTGAILEIPVLPELQQILAVLPAVDNMTLLTTSSGQAVHGGGLHRMVPRQVPRSWLTAWLIGAWLAQGRMSSIRRGQLHGPPNRGVFRPRFIEGSATLHKGR